MDSRNKIFTGAACLGVVVILLYQFLSVHQDVYWISVFFLGLLMFVCESLGENLHTRGGSTYGIMVLVAAMLALNTPSAMLVALCGAFSLQDIKLKKSPWVMLFNGAQYSMGLAAASFIYHLLKGSTRAFELGQTLKSIPIMLLAMVVFWLINSAMVALADKWEYGLAPREFFTRDALKLLPNFLIYSLLGMALGVIYSQNAFHNIYLDKNSGAVAAAGVNTSNPEAYAGPYIVGTAAEAFLGFVASLFLLTLLGVAWYFSGRNLDLLRTYDQATSRLVRYLEGREPYLPGHGERVAYYSRMMAHKLKMSLYDQQKLHYAALLHDLGKVVVPREILLQKGALTRDEFEKVQQHALVGGNWLEEVPYLAETAGAILHHHEYFDGGGYLDGISGDTIPLNARILAVADAYDAMLNSRPWRDAKGQQAAEAELHENAGVQFDPELVKVFLATLEEYRAAGSPEEPLESPSGDSAPRPVAEQEEKPEKDFLSRGKGRTNKRRQKLMEERMQRRERLEREEVSGSGQGLEGETREEAPPAAAYAPEAAESAATRETQPPQAPQAPPPDDGEVV